mgnify:CR=1 FL=1
MGSVGVGERQEGRRELKSRAIDNNDDSRQAYGICICTVFYYAWYFLCDTKIHSESVYRFLGYCKTFCHDHNSDFGYWLGGNCNRILLNENGSYACACGGGSVGGIGL